MAVSAGMHTGCISGSLASNTGPRPPGYAWSQAGKQMVHVGEEVQFDFVLQDWRRQRVQPLGIADYGVAHIGNERIETAPDLEGHFRFSYVFDHVRPGDKIAVEVTAFRQRGTRDFMRIRGQWVQGDSPYDDPDKTVAGDEIQLIVYEAPIELTMVRPADELDPQTGALKLRRADGSTTSVFVDRPGRPGFTFTGPEPDGYYRIRYPPKGSELNPIGMTEVEFKIYDVLGQPHYATATLESP